MKKIYILLGLALMIPSVLTGQQWETMDGPYFIYNVTGISFGYYDLGGPGQVTYAYAVGSDLTANYIYPFNGDTPITSWGERREVPGAKHVSASRSDGQYSYATVPEGAGSEEGVHYTVNGGQTWLYNSSSQPGNLLFTGIATHPVNTDICFTSSEDDSPTLSLWRTTNGGDSWSAVGGGEISDPTETANGIYVDPNSGQQLSSTTVYACFNTQGIWKSTDGGSDWTGLSLPGYGTSYDGMDVAVKDGDGDNLYALISHSGNYELWHSDDGGSSWGNDPVHDFGSDAAFRVFVIDYDGDDGLWVVSPTATYVYAIYADPEHWAYEGSSFGDFLCGDVDLTATLPAAGIYTGKEYSLQQVYYDWSPGESYFSRTEVIEGTNMTDVVSLDCVQSHPYNDPPNNPSRESYLRTAGYNGGYVSRDRRIVIPAVFNEWETDSYLQELTTGTANGEEISAYYGREGLTYTDAYVISGSNGSGPLLIDDGYEVDYGSYNPVSFGAVTGPHFMLPPYNLAYVAGQNSLNQNVVWVVNHVSPPTYRQLYEILNIGTSPPIINDMALEWVSPGDYYICGSRTSNSENAVAYISDGSPTYFNGGLGSPYNIRDASFVAKSGELEEGYNPSILYLGTEKGVFKNWFDPEDPPDWYPANYGIDEHVEITAIANYYHVIKNWDSYSYGSQKPDSIVQYALGYDGSNDPYIYVSPDSGRSWIEFGENLREDGIEVSDITTFTDIRQSFPTRAYLGAGTDDGVYRFRYNVRSGALADDETWGPGIVIINGDLTVPSGVTLTIKAGTEILFTFGFDRTAGGDVASKSELIVQGSLKAAGSSGQLITFDSSHPAQAATGDWYGIRALANSSINLAYCEIRHAYYGIKATSPSLLILDHCTIQDNDSKGVYLVSAPTGTKILHSKILDCGAHGIYASGGEFSAEYDTISGNRCGIGYKGDGSPTIENCVITYSSTVSSSYGISASSPSGTAKVRVDADSISGFDQGGIYFKQIVGDTMITESWVVSSGVYGIKYENSSAGIIGGASAASKNHIEGNTYGLHISGSNSPVVRRTKFKNNTSYGAYVGYGSSPNFGTTASEGKNSFIKEGPYIIYYHLYNAGLTSVYAQKNWWGQDEEEDPNPALIHNAVYYPWLDYDPLPRLVPDRDRAVTAEDFELAKAYPNPFNPTTVLRFNLSSPQFVTVKVYNIMGQEVKTVFEGFGSAGENKVTWDGRNAGGVPVSAGVYLMQMRSADRQRTVKMTVLR